MPSAFALFLFSWEQACLQISGARAAKRGGKNYVLAIDILEYYCFLIKSKHTFTHKLRLL